MAFVSELPLAMSSRIVFKALLSVCLGLFSRSCRLAMIETLPPAESPMPGQHRQSLALHWFALRRCAQQTECLWQLAECCYLQALSRSVPMAVPGFGLKRSDQFTISVSRFVNKPGHALSPPL